jgi:hypothetical protein
MRWAVRVARVEEKRNAFTVLVGKLEVKRPLGGPRRRRDCNIKTDRKNRIVRFVLGCCGSGQGCDGMW